MNTRSTSSRLYRHLVRLGTCGSASSTQVLHLLLGLRLEKHENKYHQGEAAKLGELRMLVAAPPLEREGYGLDKRPGPVHCGTYDSKLDGHLYERSPLWLGLVQFWRKIVNKSGDQERKCEAKDANPRDAQCFDQLICHIILLVENIMVLAAGVRSPASSSDPVKVYDNHGFAGTSASFSSVGDYVVSTSTTGIGNDKISSIKVDPGWSARLYENTNFTGYSYPYTYNQKNITNKLDNKVSAIRITRTPAPAPAPAPAPSSPSPVSPPKPAPEASNWWIIAIVIIILILLGVGFFMYSKSKSAAVPANV